MTRIDFYILPAGAPASLIATACKLCDKASAQGLRLFVRSPDAAQREELDGALWSFRQGSFIAHEAYHGQAISEPYPQVLIGDAEEPPASHHGVLINLGEDVPVYFSRFERVLEIVPPQDTARASSRARFKFYRDRGYPLETHEL
ncbi:MAG: DNA polymerase III subunit chi [Gammaproteobacteria bacterium]